MPPETHWVLLSRCPSVGHAELLLAALGQQGLDDSSVVCRGCGEESPANFETCWSCGVVLPIDRR